MSTDRNKVAAALYEEHRDLLRRYIDRRVPNADPTDSEDVVQQVFVQTLEHLNNGKSVKSESARGFLTTTARHLIGLMFFRRPQYKATDCNADMDEFATDPGRSSPERRIMVQQQIDALNIALESLPERYQEVFYRRRVLGESCREIAVDMNLTEESVSVFASRAGRLMKEYCVKRNILLNDFTED
jgi:RNA polymerase sigma factor (sigma-70 family)